MNSSTPIGLLATEGTAGEGIVVAHFIVSDDVERSRRFYTEILGGTVVFRHGDLTYVAIVTCADARLSNILHLLGPAGADSEWAVSRRPASRGLPNQRTR